MMSELPFKNPEGTRTQEPCNPLQFVMAVMQYSSDVEVAQMVVVEAIRLFTSMVSESPPLPDMDPEITFERFQAVAREIHKKWVERYEHPVGDESEKELQQLQKVDSQG